MSCCGSVNSHIFPSVVDMYKKTLIADLLLTSTTHLLLAHLLAHISSCWIFVPVKLVVELNADYFQRRLSEELQSLTKSPQCESGQKFCLCRFPPDYLWVLLPDVFMVIISEVAVDVIKHAFITKFNDISADVSAQLSLWPNSSFLLNIC